MRNPQELLTVTCVAPTNTRKHLQKLLQRAGVHAKGADRLEKRPEGDVVICELKANLWKETSADDWSRWSQAVKAHLGYLRFGSAHELSHVFMCSGSTGAHYVKFVTSVFDHVRPEQRWLRFVRSPEDAVTQILRIAHHGSGPTGVSSTLDGVPDVQQITDDLRADGRLSADKIKRVFGLDTMAELAKAAGISRQALDLNPSTPAVIPVLEVLEQIARVRNLPPLQAPEAFRAWWRRKLPVLNHRSPYEAWKAGRGRAVVELVDSLITGDTRG